MSTIRRSRSPTPDQGGIRLRNRTSAGCRVCGQTRVGQTRREIVAIGWMRARYNRCQDEPIWWAVAGPNRRKGCTAPLAGDLGKGRRSADPKTRSLSAFVMLDRTNPGQGQLNAGLLASGSLCFCQPSGLKMPGQKEGGVEQAIPSPGKHAWGAYEIKLKSCRYEIRRMCA